MFWQFIESISMLPFKLMDDLKWIQIYDQIFLWVLMLLVNVVLVRVTTTVMKHHTQKQDEEDRVCLPYTSTSLFIIKGN